MQVNDPAELDVVHVRRAEGLSDIGKNVSIASVRVIKARSVEKDKLLAPDEALVGFRFLRAYWWLMFVHHPQSLVLTYMIQVNVRLGAHLHRLCQSRAEESYSFQSQSLPSPQSIALAEGRPTHRLPMCLFPLTELLAKTAQLWS